MAENYGRIRFMKKIAYIGVLASLACICSYIETLIPLPISIPGVKLGLANIVVLFALFKMDVLSAGAISFVRIMITGFLFGNPGSMAYSLGGAVLSIVVMYLISKKLHIITVSIVGSVMHIIGQLVVAGAMVGYAFVLSYLPWLMLSAIITGAIIGMIADILIKRIVIDTNH